MTAPGNNRARVSVSNAQANIPVAISLPANAVTDETGGELTSIGLTPARDRSFDLDVSPSRDAPGGIPGLETAGRISAITYFDIQHSIPDEDIAGVTFRLRVSKARIEALDGDPANVAMYRYTEGWDELETELVEESEQFYIYDVTSPGLSVFAIGVKRPSIGVADAHLDRSRISVADRVLTTATIENTGLAQGTFDVELTVDGSVVDTQTVTVPAGESVTVTFDRTFDAVGEFEIAVSGTSAGTLTVEAAQTPTATATAAASPTASPTPSPEQRGPPLSIGEPGGLGLAVIGILMVLALIGALIVLNRRRRGF